MTLRLETLLVVGNYPSRELILHTTILVGWFTWELNPEVLGALSRKATATWVGGIRAAELPGDCSLHRLGCLLRDCLGWPAGRQIAPVSQVTSVGPRSAQVPSELPYQGVPLIS
jgi:hypothetical protein